MVKTMTQSDAARVTRIVVPTIAPKWDSGVFHWSLEEIRNARDAQLRGEFELPAKLVESFKTDDAIFTALKNRLAPQSCIGVDVDCDEVVVACEANAEFGADGASVSVETLSDIHHDFVNHGVAFGHVKQIARMDGSRVDFVLEHWPIRFVRWDQLKQRYVTRTDNKGEVEIEHGNGEWLVFSKHSKESWKKDAAVLPGALVWAAHAFAANDWAKGSRSHGNAKVVGEMPEGYAIEDENGLTREAQQFLMLLGAIANDDGPSGIRPFGSKVEYLINSSSAWQVWQSLLENREKAAARIYLGTDGTLGASGGAPGVDITALFGVATTIVQGDLKCIERALQSGLIVPWSLINFGRIFQSLRRIYLLPDQDEEAVRNNYADRSAKFQAGVKAAKENGFVLDQAFINAEAEKYGITPPMLATPTVQPLTPASESAEIVDAGPSYAQRLSDKMTAAQIDRCVHGGVNKCLICGIRKEIDYDLNDDGKPDIDENGQPISSFVWVPIT